MEPKTVRKTLQVAQKTLRFIATELLDPQAQRMLKLVQEDIQSVMPALDAWAAQANGEKRHLTMANKLTIRRARYIDEYRKDHVNAKPDEIAAKFGLRVGTVEKYLQGKFTPTR